MIALLFVFTVALISFSTMSALFRFANEDPVMDDMEVIIHALIIGVGLVGSLFVPALMIPAMISLVFFAPQTW